MILAINEKNEIVGYAVLGGIDGSYEFDGVIPENFEEKFKPGFYLLKDEEIVINQDYQKPSITIPDQGPSAEMLAINALGLQFAKHLAGGE